LGLKENVIIGHLIPAGTGIQKYRTLQAVEDKAEIEALEKTAEPVAAGSISEIFKENA
jgi:DNA-directed RNA polymerase subunit beta'